MRVGALSAGRAGDKGDALDLTIVARDADAYDTLERFLTPERVAQAYAPLVDSPVQRHLLPGLHALKFVLPTALPGGVYAGLHPGLHWQKGAIYVLLDLEIA